MEDKVIDAYALILETREEVLFDYKERRYKIFLSSSGDWDIQVWMLDDGRVYVSDGEGVYEHGYTFASTIIRDIEGTLIPFDANSYILENEGTCTGSAKNAITFMFKEVALCKTSSL